MKTMTRIEFLKGSGFLAASTTSISRTLLAAATQPYASTQVLLKKLAAYQIVIPDGANSVEQRAAETLQHYGSELSHGSLAIRKESDYTRGPAFFVGQTRYAKAHGGTNALHHDGYALQPVSNNLILTGGNDQGLLYGIYGLLEMWGFRMYTSKAIVTPEVSSVSIPKSAVIVAPKITYRTVNYPDTRDTRYTEWHHLSSRENWGLFVHTFNELVSPDEYGKSHPEYFSLVNGQRLPGTQLCLSNPDVLAVVIASLKKRMAEKPAAGYWSVSQNDNDQYCHCDRCTALNTKYGNVPSGSILVFVNDVAKAFPDKTISTLAYWYSRTPPQGIQAERNVNIMLCNIESKRQGPVFDTDPAFSRELIAWGKISNNILIWDYNIQFSNLVSPFPNLHTIKPNIKFYTDHNVNSLYMQSNGQVGGEFAGLRAYLIAEMMWNPDADDNAVINDYLNGFYGAAGPYVRQYIDRQRESMISSGIKLNIFGGPEDAKDGYLSAEMIRAYKGFFDQAERAVAKNPQMLARVKIARLPISYAEIQIGRDEVDTPRSMFAHSADGKVFVKPEMKTLVSNFVAGCKQDGVTRVRERTTAPDDYQAAYDRVFAGVAQMQTSPSFKKTVTSTTMPAGGALSASKLTDGIFGSWESWSAPDVHWVAYKGEHMDFILDLGEVMDVHSINMDFLNAQAQPDWNLLVLPAYVSYATSVDGENFGKEIRIMNPHNPNPKVNPDIAKVPVQSFRTEMSSPVKARYIKAHGESILKMPMWHIRAGMPASILTDQIVVV
jgi:hypothetical protein